MGSNMAQDATLLQFAKQMRHEATTFEVILWRHLSGSKLGGFKFRRQHVVQQRIVDFFCPAKNLIIEVDGETHGSDTEVRYDARRDAYLRSRGGRVMRVLNIDVYADVERIVEVILAQLPPPARDKSRASSPVNGGG